MATPPAIAYRRHRASPFASIQPVASQIEATTRPDFVESSVVKRTSLISRRI